MVKISNTEAVSGVHTYVLYGEESSYGTATNVTSHLGLIQNFRPGVNNNLTMRHGYTGTGTTAREPVNSVAGILDVSWTSEFDVVNWSFMKYVLGSVSGSDTKTYTPADTPPSLTVSHNINNPGSSPTDREEIYQGSVIDVCTIRCSVGEPVMATLEGMSQLVKYDSSLSSEVSLPSDDTYVFSGADIELPDNSSLNNIIDSVEITIRANWELLKGLGSRLTQNAIARALEYSVRFTVKYVDDTLINYALGAATPTATGKPTLNTLTCKFVDGNRSAEFRFVNVQIDWNLDGTKNEALSEDIIGYPQNLTVVEDTTT